MSPVVDTHVDSKDWISEILLTKNSLNAFVITCLSVKWGKGEVLFLPKSLSTIWNSFFWSPWHSSILLMKYSSFAFLIKFLTWSQLFLYITRLSVDLSFLHTFSHSRRSFLHAKISSLIHGCVRRWATENDFTGACLSKSCLSTVSKQWTISSTWSGNGWDSSDDCISLARLDIFIDLVFLALIVFRLGWECPDRKVKVMALWSDANVPTSQLWMMSSASREITRSSVCPRTCVDPETCCFKLKASNRSENWPPLTVFYM